MREIDESTARLGSPWKGQWEIYGEPVMKLWDFPKVTIAQVHGYCVGGGTVWGLLTDMTVASEDAYFQFPVLQGMAMPAMETGIEPWLFMNWKRASEFMYTAQELSADQAKEMGLINRVVSRDRLEDEVNELAFHVAQAPLTTLMAAKANIRRAWEFMGLQEPPPTVERPVDRGHLGQRCPGVHPGRLPGRTSAAGRIQAQRRAGQGAGRRIEGTTPSGVLIRRCRKDTAAGRWSIRLPLHR